MKKHPLEVGQRKNGVWRRSEHCYVAYTRINGKYHQRSFGDDYEAALLYVERLKTESKLERLRGENPLLNDVVSKRPQRATVGDIILVYANKRRPFLREGTINFYQYLIKKVKPLSHITASNLSIEEVDQFIADLKKQGLSNKIIKEILSICRSAFRYGVEIGYLRSSVFDKAKIPKIKKHDPEPFTEEELHKIFSVLNPRHRLMFYTMFATGLRSGEILALKWGQVDFEKHLIQVVATRTRGIEGAPKTDYSIRSVFMPPLVEDELKALIEGTNISSTDYVFVTQYGQPYKEMPHEAWKESLKKAGVKYRRPYVLRHTHASHALQSGINLAYVSATLGHSDTNVTAQKYIRYLEEKDQSEQDKLNTMLQNFGGTFAGSSDFPKRKPPQNGG